jgi:hypothetical protein
MRGTSTRKVVMMVLVRIAASLFVGLAFLAFLPSRAAGVDRFSVEIEAGPAWQGRNDIEIPNDGTASRFSASALIGKGPYFAYRAYVTCEINAKNGLRLLAAPLTIEGSGTPAEEIRYDGRTFQAGVPTDASYRFDSYRLTWRYLVAEGSRFRAHVGFTAKVRAAEVRLSQGSVEASYDNVGFVPLLHLAAEWKLSERWSAVLDADALAAPQGRAEDVALKLSWRWGDRWSAAAGYRTVEGGADNDKVYTFAWLHYVAASVSCDF